MSFYLKVSSDSISAAFSKLTNRTSDPRPALRSVGEFLLLRTQERFDSEVDPEGKSWAPLAASTLRSKRNRKILTESTALRRSIVYRVSDAGVEIGTNIDYASIHQFGGAIAQAARTRTLNFRIDRDGKSRFAKKKRANFQQDVQVGSRTVVIPRREFLGVSERDREEIARIVMDHWSHL